MVRIWSKVQGAVAHLHLEVVHRAGLEVELRAVGHNQLVAADREGAAIAVLQGEGKVIAEIRIERLQDPDFRTPGGVLDDAGLRQGHARRGLVDRRRGVHRDGKFLPYGKAVGVGGADPDCLISGQARQGGGIPHHEFAGVDPGPDREGAGRDFGVAGLARDDRVASPGIALIGIERVQGLDHEPGAGRLDHRGGDIPEVVPKSIRVGASFTLVTLTMMSWTKLCPPELVVLILSVDAAGISPRSRVTPSFSFKPTTPLIPSRISNGELASTEPSALTIAY